MTLSDFLKQYGSMISAATGSVAAFFLGLLVNHLRRERCTLVYETTSLNAALRGFTKLTMRYEDRDIARLDSHVVVFTHTGNRSLVDISAKIFPLGKGKAHEIECVYPPREDTWAKAQDTEVVVPIRLLKPGEQIKISLVTTDSEGGVVKVICREPKVHFEQLQRDSVVLSLLRSGMAISDGTPTVTDLALATARRVVGYLR